MSETQQEAEKKTGLSFSDALTRIKNGEPMIRDSWLKQPVSMRIIKLTITHVSLIPGFENEEDQLALVLENDVGEVGMIKNWTPNKEDMFTDDWRVYGCVDAEVVADKMIADSVRLPGLPLIPIFTEQSKDCFVDANILEPHVVQLSDQLVETSALKFGKKMDLLGLNTNNQLLANYVQDVTDCIDPAVSLANLHFLVDNTPVKVNVLGLPLGAAVAATMGDYRDQAINFNGKLDVGDALVTASVIGTINLQFCTIELHAKIEDVYSNMGQDVDVKLIGYDIQAYRVNPNRRPR